jgi:hypothetical protein
MLMPGVIMDDEACAFSMFKLNYELAGVKTILLLLKKDLMVSLTVP